MLRSSSLIVRRVAASARVVRLTTLSAVAVQRTTTFPYATEHSHQLNRCNQLSTSSSTEATSDHGTLDWKHVLVGRMDREAWNAALENITEIITTIESESDDDRTATDQLKTAMITYERLLDESRYMLQNSTQQQQPVQSSAQHNLGTPNGAVQDADLQHLLSSKFTRDIIRKWFQIHKRYYSSKFSERTKDTNAALLSPQKMYEWLEYLRTKFGADQCLSVTDEESYRLVITALSLQQSVSKSSNIDYAMRILENFIDAYKSKQSTLLCSDWFTIVINMCVKFERFDVVDKVLKEAESMYYKADDGRQLPFCTADMYIILMVGCLRRDDYKKSRLYFDRFMSIPALQPTLDICRLQLKSISDYNCGDTTEDARNAEALLMKMLNGAQNRGWNTYPTIECIKHVVSCWAACEDSQRTARIEVMLDIADMLPWRDDIISYCNIYYSAMFAWGLERSSESIDRVQTLYERLVKNVGDENLIPPGVRRQYMISQIVALSRSTEPDVYVKVRAMFDKYIELRKSKGDVKWLPPANRLYTPLLYAYGKAGKPREAEEILTTMIDDYKSGKKDACPQTLCFTHTAVAWKNSKHEDARYKIRQTFQTLAKLRTQKGFTHLDPPGTSTYSLLIHTYQGSRHTHLALEGDKYYQQILKLSQSGDKRYQPSLLLFMNAMGLWENITDPIAVEHATNTMDRTIDWCRHNSIKVKNISQADIHNMYEKIVVNSSLPSDKKNELLAKYRHLVEK